jgi:BirA family biotin operon repressor/biotin-[acetyl-CoA-carboxylase] ligase
MTLPFADPPQIVLPPGYRALEYDRIDSTNAEALRCAEAGEPGGLWITADEQTGGRGRAGRVWHSPPGNLYASVLLRPRCLPSAAPGLSLLAAVAARQAIANILGELAAEALTLKWPNDILLNSGKLGGVLLESVQTGRRNDLAVVIGVGVNIAQSPDNLGRRTERLAAYAPDATVPALFEQLASAMHTWMTVWRDGENFAAIRAEWLRHAHGLGAQASVRVNGTVVDGLFLGLDEQGALRLGDRAGSERRVTAGDVFFG